MNIIFKNSFHCFFKFKFDNYKHKFTLGIPIKRTKFNRLTAFWRAIKNDVLLPPVGRKAETSEPWTIFNAFFR